MTNSDIVGLPLGIEEAAKALARADCDPLLMSEIAIGLYVEKRWPEKIAHARAAIEAYEQAALSGSPEG